jgi:hypothetical protein
MGVPAYMESARQAPPPPFDPGQSQVVARLRAQGMPEEDIQSIIAEHDQEWNAA